MGHVPPNHALLEGHTWLGMPKLGMAHRFMHAIPAVPSHGQLPATAIGPFSWAHVLPKHALLEGHTWLGMPKMGMAHRFMHATPPFICRVGYQERDRYKSRDAGPVKCNASLAAA